MLIKPGTGAIFVLVFLLGHAAIAPAFAQAPAPGTRVRVTRQSLEDLSREQATGLLRAYTTNELTLLGDSGSLLRIPMESVDNLEISLGMASRAGRGAKIGMGVGLAATALLMLGIARENSGDQFQGALVFLGALVGIAGTAALAGIGALIGAGFRSERWALLPVPTTATDPERRSRRPSW